MAIISINRRYFNISLLVINLFCSCAFGREYVLEVSPAQQGFTITTNIPRASAPQSAAKKDEPIPTVTFNAQTQQLLLSEEGNMLEILLDNVGYVTVKQMNMADTLCIKNSASRGNIVFDGVAPQKAHELNLNGRSCFVQTDLSVDVLKASFSGSFINNRTLTINKIQGKSTPNQKNMLLCRNFDNNTQIILDGDLQCTVADMFRNSSHISGDGNLEIISLELVNEAAASITLKGKLSIGANNKDGVKLCESNDEQCGSTGGIHCLNWFEPASEGAEDKIFMTRRYQQEVNLHRKGRSNTITGLRTGHYKFRHSGNASCYNCFLLGLINVGELVINTLVVELEGHISADNTCHITSEDYFRNSGVIYSKSNIDIEVLGFFNDANSSVSALKKLKIEGKNAVVANVSGVFVADEIEISAKKFINARVERDFVRDDTSKRKYRFLSVDDNPASYVFARTGNLTIAVDDFMQDASVAAGNNEVHITVKNEFKNYARELKRFVYGGDIYEPSTIAAGGKVLITLGEKTVDFNGKEALFNLPNFHNTGTIQGQQILSLDVNDKARVINGFTHKRMPAKFSSLTSQFDLEPLTTFDLGKHLIPGEYEHKQDGTYYYTHPLFNENKPFKEMYSVAIEHGDGKPNTPFLMSPLLEATGMELALQEHTGKMRLSGFKDHYEQLDILQRQGFIYALVHGTLIYAANRGKVVILPNISLTNDEKKYYQEIIAKFKGSITPEEYARRLNALNAKTHIIELEERQIHKAPVSFICYKTENHDGKDYLHPYLHIDTESLVRLRRADGSLEGGDVTINGGNAKNYGLIKADKQLLIKVSSFLNEKPLQERIDGIYKIIDVKQGGDASGAKVDVTVTEKDLTNKGGTMQSTNGDTTLKTEKGSINLLTQEKTNQDSLDKATMHEQGAVKANGGSLNLNSAQDINSRGTAKMATNDIKMNAKRNINEETLLDVYEEEIIEPDGTRKTVQRVTETPTTNVAGAKMERTAGQTLTDIGVENLSVGDQVNTAKNIISKPAEAKTTETESQLTCSLLGCSGKDKTTLRTIVRQSKYTSLKGSVINKSDLDTVLEGVVIVAGKKIRLVAGKKLTVKGAKETTSTTESGWSFGVSFLGSDAIESAAQGDHKEAGVKLLATSKLAASLLTLMENVDKKNSAADVVTNLEYAGIEAVREFVNLSKTPEGAGLKGGPAAAGQRLAAAASQISFNLGFYNSQTDSFSTEPSTFNCAELEIDAPEAELLDGVQAKGDKLKIKAQTLKTTGAESGATSSNSGFGVTLSVGVTGVGVGVEATAGDSKETNYENANFAFKDQEYEVEDIDSENTNADGKTVNYKKVKKLKLSSKQNTKEKTQLGGGIFASTSGAASASASYENEDVRKVGKRTGHNFEEEASGSIETVDLTAADLAAGKQSTVKIDEMKGHDLKDYDNSIKASLSASSVPDSAVYATAEPNVKIDLGSGTHHAYSNLKAGTKTNVVDDPSQAYVEDKGFHTHVRFVLAALDMKQIKEAEHKMHDLFDSRRKLRVKEVREAQKLFGMPDAKEEILRERAEREKSEHSQTSSDKPDAQNNEQNSDKPAGDGNKQNAQEEQNKEQKSEQQAEQPAVDDELDVHDDDGSDNFGTHKEAPCEAKQKSSKPDSKSEKTKQENAPTADPEKEEALKKFDKLTQNWHKHKTSSGKTIIIGYSADSVDDTPFDAINLEDIEYDAQSNINTLLLKNNGHVFTITGEKEAFAEMLLDRKMLINSLIQQSGISHSESFATDEHHTLKIIASLLLDFVPAVGNAKMASEAIRGVDLVTGEPLPGWQRWLCAFGAAAPFLVKGLKAAANGGKLIVEGVSELSKGAKAAEAINEINKGAKVAGATGEIAKAEKIVQEATKANRYAGELIQVNKADQAADALAKRIGGQSRVKFSSDPLAREFDVISKEYIGQTKPALSTINKSVRDQMKATFEAAKETSKKVYYHFEGQPHSSVINKLNEYSKRYGIDVVIDTNPLKK